MRLSRYGVQLSNDCDMRHIRERRIGLIGESPHLINECHFEVPDDDRWDDQ